MILPFFPKRPGGGFKIMFEYANRLSQQGFDITIYFSLNTSYSRQKYPHSLFIRVAAYNIIYPNAKPRWFNLSKKIKARIIPKVNDNYIDDADYTMSTWWATAFEVYKLSKTKGKKINLIQDFEYWDGYEDLLYESYKLPITHIVINDFLKDLVVKTSGISPTVIYNGIDKNEYFIKTKIEDRKNATICMHYSKGERKGSKYGLEALYLCKKLCPDLSVDLFSISKRPEGLSDWIKFHRDPNNLIDIYNMNAIYFSPNNSEGWDLPATEGMFCGCALVCTDIPGHAPFLRDGDFNLGVKIKDPKDMSEKLLMLLMNPERRIDYAGRGNIFVQRFGWDTSIKKLLDILTEINRQAL
jgi:glycosyltransferase involved in cell wall biosynthesis